MDMYDDRAIISAIEDAAYDCGCVNFNLREYAQEYGYYTRVSVIDGNGNEVDHEYIITRKSLQEIADIFAPGFDAINF